MPRRRARLTQTRAEQHLSSRRPAPSSPVATPGHATGPRTSEGKRISSRNSLKHGLSTGELLIPGEDRADFDALLQNLLAEHQPANSTEELLVQEMAQSFWLTQRAIRLQATCFSDTGEIDTHKLALFLRYQTTHERAFQKALSTLIRLKKERRSQPSQFVSQNTKSANGFVSQNSSSAPITSNVPPFQPAFQPPLTSKPSQGAQAT